MRWPLRIRMRVKCRGYFFVFVFDTTFGLNFLLLNNGWKRLYFELHIWIRRKCNECKKIIMKIVWDIHSNNSHVIYIMQIILCDILYISFGSILLLWDGSCCCSTLVIYLLHNSPFHPGFFSLSVSRQHFLYCIFFLSEKLKTEEFPKETKWDQSYCYIPRLVAKWL